MNIGHNYGIGFVQTTNRTTARYQLAKFWLEAEGTRNQTLADFFRTIDAKPHTLYPGYMKEVVPNAGN